MNLWEGQGGGGEPGKGREPGQHRIDSCEFLGAPGTLCLQLAELASRWSPGCCHGNFLLLVLIFPRAGLSPPARLIETNLRGQGLSLPLILLRGPSHGPNYSHTGPFIPARVSLCQPPFLKVCIINSMLASSCPSRGHEMLSRAAMDKVTTKAFYGLRFVQRR